MTTMLIDKIHLKDLEETLANSTPLLAVVGAGDLAVEKIRAAREELAGRAASFDPKAFRDQAQASFSGRVEALQAELLSAPDQIRALPEKAQEWPAKAQSLFADVVSTAFSTYGDLAGRGKSRVTQVRREHPILDDTTPVSRPTASEAKTSTKTATKKPAAKKTTARKSTAKKTPANRATAKTTTTKLSATTKKATTPATKAADTHT